MNENRRLYFEALVDAYASFYESVNRIDSVSVYLHEEECGCTECDIISGAENKLTANLFHFRKLLNILSPSKEEIAFTTASHAYHRAMRSFKENRACVYSDLYNELQIARTNFVDKIMKD